jgi:6-pyruvoyltetrahydropterin/6-carboxytetrahydropterin synthase
MVPHGHNWFVSVTVSAAEPKPLDRDKNMVVEFKRAKADWHRWVDENMDHTFQLNARDPLIDWFRREESERLSRVLVCPGDPTTEMLAALWMCKAQAFMDAAGNGLIVDELALEETPTNTVILSGRRAYESHVPLSRQGEFWWERADASINDLGNPS